MHAEILSYLAPVRSRLRTQKMISLLAPGAAIGGGLCVVLGFIRLTFEASIGWPLIASVFFGSVAVAAIAGLLLKRPWGEAASAVDQHYELKDRTISALEFSHHTDQSPFRELQLNDARRYLQSVNAKDVVPFRPPHRWRWAVLSVVAAMLLMVAPVGDNTLHANVANSDGIAEAAEQIQDEIEEMEELAEESGIEELQHLVDQLKEDLDQLEKPEAELRESLETISEMQQKMQQMMASMNVAAMDAQLADVAEAMSGAQAFKSVSDSLKNENLDEAAKALEDVNPTNMERTESRPTSEKLSVSAAAAKKKGMNKFSDALEQLSEHVKTGDCDGICKDCKGLARTVRAHGLQKKLEKMLAGKCNKLGECKSMCAGACNKEGNQGSRGAGSKKLAGQARQKSNSPSQKASATSAGNINGNKTKLNGEMQMAKLSGQMGQDGESEFETETSLEAEEQAQRKASEAFAKYQKMSEAVLDSEPIPLGHRQTIRRYFELIRPTKEQAEAIDNATGTK